MYLHYTGKDLILITRYQLNKSSLMVDGLSYCCCCCINGRFLIRKRILSSTINRSDDLGIFLPKSDTIENGPDYCYMDGGGGGRWWKCLVLLLLLL